MMPMYRRSSAASLQGIIFLLLVSSSILAKTNIDLNGYIRNETGVFLDTDKNGEFSLMKNTLNLELNYRNNDQTIGAKATPFIYYYDNENYKMDVRELYIDIFLKSMDIRIGKQQIIWGKADGVFITDIVSPKDLTEFLLPDFNEIRMGVTSVKLDYYLGNSTIEFVWVPIFEPTKMPETDTIWAANMPLPVNVNMTFNMSKKGITPSLENSEFFFKYSLLSSAIDFEIMGGYTWDDDPTLHTSQTIVNSTPQLTVSPEHHRLGVLGGSFGKDIAGIFVLRGEIAYYYQKYFLLNNIDTLTNENTDQRDYIHYLIGIDATPFWEITMSIQFIQRAILNYDDNIKDNQFDNTMTFLLRKLFLRDTLTVELFAYYGITNEDALIKPKIAYKFTDELELSIGAYIFVGNNDGLFGQYKDNNMAYIKAKLSF